MGEYFEALTTAMGIVGQERRSVFLGQGVGNPGTSMSDSFSRVPPGRVIEMPVAEDLQMGMAIGMSLGGMLPICVFPRWNFLLCAANQLVNHLDRLELISDYRPKVIIRVATPSTAPFYPGPQHDDDFSGPFDFMLRKVKVQRLRQADEIIPAYEDAVVRSGSTILVEYTDQYRNERGSK